MFEFIGSVIGISCVCTGRALDKVVKVTADTMYKTGKATVKAVKTMKENRINKNYVNTQLQDC